MLALAYHLDQLIEHRVLRDYADAARVLGVSRARVTQFIELLGQPVAVRNRILLGDHKTTERRHE